MTEERRGKRVDLRQLVDQGRERAAGDTDASDDALLPGDPRAAADPALLPGDPRGDASAPAPPEPAAATPHSPGAPEREPQPAPPPPGDPGVTLAALYVRVPEHLKDRVENAAFALKGLRPRPTHQELVAMLIDQQPDPSTPEALATWERQLKRFRRRQAT